MTNDFIITRTEVLEVEAKTFKDAKRLAKKYWRDADKWRFDNGSIVCEQTAEEQHLSEEP